MKTIAFFNNKGGVGKTSLVYHLSWIFRELGLRVVAADLDPQSNLSAMFLSETRLEEFWPDGEHPRTVWGAVRPIIRGIGDIAPPHVEEIAAEIGLVVGDLGLSSFEDRLALNWPLCLDRQEAAFRTETAFHRLLAAAASHFEADLVLIDVGPNLGAINRAALIAAQHVVLPLAPDLFSLQGLRNLGPTLGQWRNEWSDRQQRNPDPLLDLPEGAMQPAGYVVMQHAMRLDRPVRAYARWADRIPIEYQQSVLGHPDDGTVAPDSDPHRLALIKHFRSLMPMAMEARKPMFFLKPADGAIGAHSQAVREVYREFEDLARRIAESVGLALPLPAGT